MATVKLRQRLNVASAERPVYSCLSHKRASLLKKSAAAPCCVAHDEAYTQGGDSRLRHIADAEFLL